MQLLACIVSSANYFEYEGEKKLANPYTNY